ncbi:capsular polysaccharide biosynthesis protein [Bordetella avium]|nr:capsular polysaccharide biosynthesis protein [Bordetella avium]
MGWSESSATFVRLGSAPGLWPLHPPCGSSTFHEKLPPGIAAVESGQRPQAQHRYCHAHDHVGRRKGRKPAHKRWPRLLKDPPRIGH